MVEKLWETMQFGLGFDSGLWREFLVSLLLCLSNILNTPTLCAICNWQPINPLPHIAYTLLLNVLLTKRQGYCTSFMGWLKGNRDHSTVKDLSINYVIGEIYGREVVSPNDYGITREGILTIWLHVYSIQHCKELAQLCVLVIESHRGKTVPDGADNQSTYQ